MRLRYKIGIVFGILLSVFLWGRCGRSKPDVPSGPLPKDDLVRITVNPRKHHLRIEQQNHKPIDTFLPDRPSTFEVKQNGTVKVSSAQMGFETIPFVGLGFGNGFRAYAGADLWYFKKLDLGLAGVSPQLFAHEVDMTDFRIGAFTSYTIYDNLRLTVGYDTSKTIHVLTSVRF